MEEELLHLFEERVGLEDGAAASRHSRVHTQRVKLFAHLEVADLILQAQHCSETHELIHEKQLTGIGTVICARIRDTF